MSKLQITFLGTGTSTGIPIVACKCETCCSTDPKDKRTRASIFIEKNDYSFIIDTGPDLRTQLLRESIIHCDFAIITHDHSDHLLGLDDLRPFTFLPERRELPVFAHEQHIPSIIKKFEYIFKRNELYNNDRPYQGGGLPLLNLYPIEKLNQFFPNLKFDSFLLPHGGGNTLGLSFDDFAYVIDCHEIPKGTVQKLSSLNLQTLIIDCLQEDPHPSHLTVKKCFDYISQIKPKKAWLTHMNHDLSHKHLTKLSKNTFDNTVLPAFDGLKIKP